MSVLPPFAVWERLRDMQQVVSDQLLAEGLDDHEWAALRDDGLASLPVSVVNLVGVSPEAGLTR
jgi:hypothetical protein